MLKDYTIRGINDILRRNNIPWLFSQDSIGNNDEFNRDLCSDRPVDNTKKPREEYLPNILENSDFPYSDSSSSADINIFPADFQGPLENDFLGICGLDSGNNSLRAVFSAMNKWTKEHVKNDANNVTHSKLSATILTDKWNAGDYKRYCQNMEELNIRFVVILLVSDYPVQLPYTYSNITINDFICKRGLDGDRAEAIKHAARIMMYDSRAIHIADLDNNELGIGRMCWEAFERGAVKDILIDLRKAIDYM